jgi:general secretion pathway protein B
MSYILDALKKADKERKRGTVPDLATVQAPAPLKPRKRSLWPYLVVVALLINAGIFLLWLNPWETEETTTVAKAPPIVIHESQEKASLLESSEKQTDSTTISSEPVKTTPSKMNPPQEKSPHELQATTTSKEQANTHQQQETIAPYAIQEDASPEESSQKLPPEPSAPSTTTPYSPTADTSTSDQQRSFPDKTFESRFRLYDFKDLPSSVKDNLPDINISVFVYSDDPSSRIVKINGQTMREGQELTDGLKVEKIVPEGVIFHYEDYRFRIRIR